MSYNTDLQSNNADLQAILDAVNALPEAGVDTSDATATASDMAEGATAYVDGEKVTGAIPAINSSNIRGMTPEVDGDSVKTTTTHWGGLLLKPGATDSHYVKLEKFGDATAEDVVSGKTFTSADGLKVTGTATLGVDTSDATATASDMAQGVTAYVNGEKVTGTIPWAGTALSTSHSVWLSGDPYVQGDYIYAYNTYPFTERKIVDEKTNFAVAVDPSKFGDATAADVAAGKTFTSAAGVKVTGSLETLTSLPVVTQDVAPTMQDGYIYASTSNLYVDKAIVERGVGMRIGTTATQFGDATAEDVVSGKTFTSAAGVKVTGTYEPQAAGATVLTAESTPTANSLTLTFTGLSGEPTTFSIDPVENITLSTTRQISNVTYDGTSTVGAYLYRASTYGSSTSTYSSTAYSYTYSNGTLTITSSSATAGGYFSNGITYKLVYITDPISDGGGSGGGSVVSVRLGEGVFYGFDANGNPFSAGNGTYAFLEGIVMAATSDLQITGNYVSANHQLHRFLTDGGYIVGNSGASGGS